LRNSIFAALFVAIAGFVLLSGCTVPQPPVCGDGVCDIGETCTQDCDIPPVQYHSECKELKCVQIEGNGDDQCSADEECAPIDCIDQCGNGVCDEYVCQGPNCPCAETAKSCEKDCPITPAESSIEIKDNMISSTSPLEASFDRQTNPLTKKELGNLFEGTITLRENGQNYETSAKEQLLVSANPRFNTASDVERMALDIDAGAFKYLVSFSKGIKQGMTGKIPLLGKLYEIKSLDLTTAGSERILLLSGTERVEIVNNKGFPYDSSNNTGIYDWKAKLLVSSNELNGIEISNSNKRWNDSAALKLLETAKFADSGKYSITFDGWTASQSTGITIGKQLIEYTDESKVTHSIPMVIKLDYSDDMWQSIAFDGKTIFFQVDKTDQNFTLFNRNSINGRIIDQITVSGNTITLTVDGVQRTLSLNSKLDIDGFSFGITTAANGKIALTSDGRMQFLNNSTTRSADTLAYLGDSNTQNPGYGYLYYTDKQTHFASINHFGQEINNIDLYLQGSNSKLYNYAVRVNESSNRLWLALGQARIKGQQGKEILFYGTDTLENGPASTVPDTEYYKPDDAAFDADPTDTKYYVAKFGVQTGADGTGLPEFHAFISTVYGNGNLITLPNPNLSNYAYQATRNANTAGNIQALNLRSDTPASYYSEAFDDAGAYVSVANGTQAVFKLPSQRPMVQETVTAN